MTTLNLETINDHDLHAVTGGSIAGQTAQMAGVGAAIGTIGGAIIGGVPTAGIGALPGAGIGAALGTGIGAVVGAVGAMGYEHGKHGMDVGNWDWASV